MTREEKATCKGIGYSVKAIECCYTCASTNTFGTACSKHKVGGLPLKTSPLGKCNGYGRSWEFHNKIEGEPNG